MPTSIKDTIYWFTFITIIYHTANILKPNKGLIPSLLQLFAMFQLRLFYDKYNEEGNIVYAIATRCSNFNKETGLHIKNTTIEDITTKFVKMQYFIMRVCRG